MKISQKQIFCNLQDDNDYVWELPDELYLSEEEANKAVLPGEITVTLERAMDRISYSWRRDS